MCNTPLIFMDRQPYQQVLITERRSILILVCRVNAMFLALFSFAMPSINFITPTSQGQRQRHGKGYKTEGAMIVRF